MTRNDAGVARTGVVDSFLRNSYMPSSEAYDTLKGRSLKHAREKGSKHRALDSNTRKPTCEPANTNFRGGCLRLEPHE